MSNLSIVSLVIQLFIAPLLFKNLGLIGSASLLPLSVFLGVGVVGFVPGLGAALVLRFGDGALKHSLYRSAIELLYLPVPASVKRRVKTAIDVVLQNVAAGLAGLVILALISGLELGLLAVNIALGIVCIAWMATLPWLRDLYLESFRKALRTRSLDLQSLSVKPTEAVVLKVIHPILEGGNERSIRYVQDLLEGVVNQGLQEHWKNFLSHPSSEIRYRSIRNLGSFQNLDLSAEMEELLADPSEEVRIHSLWYLCHHSSDASATLDRFLFDSNWENRTMALRAMVRFPGLHPGQPLQWTQIQKELNWEQAGTQLPDSQRRFLVQFCEYRAQTRDPDFFPRLIHWASLPFVPLRHAALLGLGHYPQKESLKLLTRALGNRQDRLVARRALTGMGSPAVQSLLEKLKDAAAEDAILRSIPRVLQDIQTIEAAQGLIHNLEHNQLIVRRRVVDALRHLRTQRQVERVPRVLVRNALFRVFDRNEELEVAMQALQSSSFSLPTKDGSFKLLKRAVEEKRAFHVRRIFALLSLVHPPNDMQQIETSLRSTLSHRRADAMELLENTLSGPWRTRALHAIENGVKERNTPLKTVHSTEAIRKLLEFPDSWIQACAVFYIARSGLEEFFGEMVLLNQMNPPHLLRETLGYAHQRMGK
ncbi:MAG: hypothetical protein F6K07_32565, partial [Okeania sp. SIO1H5]|uniref:HEAT repeat domain-containing protein n=1 Tax=Okeania sp. SIO1H5 TaxID=2607777 RepID=UPI0013B8EE57